MKTVVHYVDSNLYGGCEQVVSLLLSRLVSSDWRPVLLYHESKGLSRLVDEAESYGVVCRAIACPPSGPRFGLLRQLVDVLRSERPDMFHAHLSWPLGCRSGLIAAKLSGVPRTVATSHLVSPITEKVRFDGLKRRVQTALTDRFIAVSKGVWRDLGDFLGADQSKISVVYNGISAAQFRQPPNLSFRKALAPDRPGPLILTPARMHPQKGHRYLLEAATRFPDVTFLLVGDGPDRQKLETYADQLGLSDHVLFLGLRNDVAELLAICDLFVLPSLHEGLPLSVLEAMAACKPVIATAVSGTDEAIVHGETGLLVPPANSTALAAAISELLESPETAKKYADAARSRVDTLFSADSMTAGVIQIYDQLSSR